MSSQHTPGPWHPGKTGGAVVSEAPIDGVPVGSGHSDVEYYGGNLIAESIWRKEDVRLIAAAPDLLAVLMELTDIEGPLPGNQAWHTRAMAAIAKATGAA